MAELFINFYNTLCVCYLIFLLTSMYSLRFLTIDTHDVCIV